MKIGFFATGALNRIDFEEFAIWGAAHGFGAIDVPYERDGTRAVADRLGLTVAAMTGGGPCAVQRDPAERATAIAAIKGAIDCAARQQISTMAVNHRRVARASPEENLEYFRLGFEPLCAYAEERGVRLTMENYPANGENLGITPELWEKLFEVVPSPALGLCIDPSHLYWLGIDPYRATLDFGSRIYHAHAKDTEILVDGRDRYGIYGRQFDPARSGGSGWWRYRLPGFGAIDWARYVDVLQSIGYDGVLSIEHEDDVWGWRTDPERAKRGLLLARKFLDQFVVE